MCDVIVIPMVKSTSVLELLIKRSKCGVKSSGVKSTSVLELPIKRSICGGVGNEQMAW